MKKIKKKIKKKEPKARSIQVLVTEKTAQRFQRWAEELEVSSSALARHLIEQGLKNK